MTGFGSKPILVVGAGISGISAALEAAEAGGEVVLVEKDSTVGGRVLRNHHYFPKLCPPSCGMEINTQRLERNPRIRVLTGTEVMAASSSGAGWSVRLRRAPQYINQRCTCCGECSKVCPAKVEDPYNLGMAEVPAVRLPNPYAWPRRYSLDRSACPDGCDACVKACAYQAIDLAAKEREEELEVGAVVMATGWQPNPLESLPHLGGGKLQDVIANVQMERLSSPQGPTGGKILKPSSAEPPKKVAFVQCAGSRDKDHLPYCSAVCCLATYKQALHLHEQLPDCEITIYYVDRRAQGRNEDLLNRVAAVKNLKLVQGRVTSIQESGGSLELRAEPDGGEVIQDTADLVVLATGMVPTLREVASAFEAQCDGDGFGLDDCQRGFAVAGVSRRPQDVASSVRDATGAAAKALAAAARRAS
ncbi:MAG: FAD-dependent oxidoreductase [Anaerolineae bacterium]